MDLELTLILTGFLLFYAMNVIVNAVDKMYFIACDVDDRQKENEKEEDIPEIVKHMYS